MLNAEQLRKRAKDLLRAHRAGDPDAADRLRAVRAVLEPVKLADAQHVIAREQGFPSWPKLKSYVDRLARFGPGLRHAFHPDAEYYTGRALGLLASAKDGTPAAVAAFAARGAPLTRAGARTVVAVEHGFDSWAALLRHVRELGDEPFTRAYRAIEAQDVPGLSAALDRFPDLVHAQGTNGNDLLGMAAATHDERLVRVLLDAGAPVDHANAHGWTALHQAGYNGLLHLARMLLDAGARADLSARGDGGTPLVVALFWGHTATAEVLAAQAVAPRNLRVAAGLGRLELSGPEPGAHREFYRPHSGFPAWRPSDDPGEIRDEALSWAARNDQADAITALVAQGARLDADVYRGTALTWAAAGGKNRAVRRLLDLGADPDQRGTFGGPDHGEGVTALHLAAQHGHTETIELLLAAGADRSLRDTNHEGDALSWAEFGGHPLAAALLRAP
ncbi:ankyrin repeat domain-containing protein [Saccharothrix sp. AJ9571]|nr:ankyrin repeat domain-containing protein [Saccharothrix sp. AJ9571]